MSAAVEVFNALYYIFPAYCANAAPVLFGGGHPVDFGRKFIDGKPIFGQNKTIRGFIAGLFIGTLVGWAQETLAPNIGLEKGSVLLGLCLSLGALFGDLVGSFVKRRLDLKPGASFPVSDQIDFVLLALLFSLPVKPPTFLYAVLIIALTLPIHLLANVIAYLIRVKKRPW